MYARFYRSMISVHIKYSLTSIKWENVRIASRSKKHSRCYSYCHFITNNNYYNKFLFSIFENKRRRKNNKEISTYSVTEQILYSTPHKYQQQQKRRIFNESKTCDFECSVFIQKNYYKVINVKIIQKLNSTCKSDRTGLNWPLVMDLSVWVRVFFYWIF